MAVSVRLPPYVYPQGSSPTPKVETVSLKQHLQKETCSEGNQRSEVIYVQNAIGG